MSAGQSEYSIAPEDDKKLRWALLSVPAITVVFRNKVSFTRLKS